MTRTKFGRLLGSVLLIAALAGCGSDYSNNPGGTNAPAQAPGATTAAAPAGGYP